MCSAPLVAYPARDTDGKPQLQQGFKLGGVTGEAVRDGPLSQGSRVLAQDSNEVVMGVTDVQKGGLERALRELEKTMERRPLHGTRRQIAEIVQPALTYCDDFGSAGELLVLVQ